MPARNLEGKAILYKYGKYDALKEEFYAACALINYGIYNRVRNKYEYMLSLREIFKDIDTDSDFRWKYFSKESKEWVRNIIHKKYLRILLPARENLRRFLLSVCIRPKRGILLQILGLQLAIGKYADEYRPALWALRLGKKR